MDVLFLPALFNSAAVEMIDMRELKALGAVAGHEADCVFGWGGFEDPPGVGDGEAEGWRGADEDAEAGGGVCGGFGIERVAFGFPVINGR